LLLVWFASDDLARQQNAQGKLHDTQRMATMIIHEVRVHPEADRLERQNHLAWKIAAVASDPVEVEPAIAEMIVNRVIDNASVAIAAINRHPVTTARDQALAHPRAGRATVFGLGPHVRVYAEWAAWANGTAVRELDYHDAFLAAEYSHPGDNVPPILAVVQQCGADGRALLRGIATGYEIQVDLVWAICLHKHKIDHVAHLGPSAAAGIGTLLGLPTDIIYQSVQQALHVTTATRQSRKGEISSLKAYAPSHAGKLAVEAVDRAMRGEGAPSPIYEGEDSVIAWMLDGPKAQYVFPLPAPGDAKRAILDTYTKEHSAEYQSQALIDLTFCMGRQVERWEDVAGVLIRTSHHTSHHTHYVIGTGSNDPQKFDPTASRETLDHSIMYIVAVALQDGAWHHLRSYAPERAQRPDTVALWRKISTVEDLDWAKRYHADDPSVKAFGGRIEITMKDGRVIADEMAVANAHSLGATPWQRPDYLRKFNTLTEGVLDAAEAARFLQVAECLPRLRAHELAELTIALPVGALGSGGYDILDIAPRCGFEEIAHLLIHGTLPTEAELRGYKVKLHMLRGIPVAVRTVLEAIPAAAHPMDVMRTGVSMLGCVLPETPGHEADGARDIADRLIAPLGSMLLYWHHFALHGRRIDVETDDDSIGRHFLHMLHGERPRESWVQAMDTSLNLYAKRQFSTPPPSRRGWSRGRAPTSTARSWRRSAHCVGRSMAGPMRSPSTSRSATLIPIRQRKTSATAWLRRRSSSVSAIRSIRLPIRATSSSRLWRGSSPRRCIRARCMTSPNGSRR